MAKKTLRVLTPFKMGGTGRPKPNTVNPTLTKSRRYDKGGKLKTSNK